MKKTTFVLLLCCSLAPWVVGCGGGGDDDDDGIDASGGGDDGSTTEYAPADLDGKDVAFDEGSFTNTWTFPDGAGTEGTATLQGVDDFPFVYAKTGANTSQLNFDVQGDDQYDMLWTSATGGTFEESFDGEPGTSGTFLVTDTE
jgi:hypothetical protein